MHHAWQRLQHGAGSNFQDLFAQVRVHLGVIPSLSEADGWLGQARLFERTGRVDIALRFYEQALLLRPDAAVRAHLGHLRAASAAPPAPETASETPELPAANDAANTLASAIAFGKSLLEQRAMWTNRGAMTLANADLLVTELFGAKPRTTGSAWTEDQLALGAFIGEVYCRRFNGQWQVASITPMT